MVAVDCLPVTIRRFSPALAPHFHRLNAEWLQRYFSIEPIDAEVLGDPFCHIVQPGGEILFAQQGAAVVGTGALKVSAAGKQRFELTKMAVTASAQGHGVGRLLLEAALASYRALQGQSLFLETNSQLKPAIRLYESVGFRQQPHPQGASVYQRADVYMVYEPQFHRGSIACCNFVPAAKTVVSNWPPIRRKR